MFLAHCFVHIVFSNFGEISLKLPGNVATRHSKELELELELIVFANWNLEIGVLFYDVTQNDPF